jgi:flagellin-like hook-associated protein FlgL
MAINSMSSSASLLGQSVANIKNQLNSLQVQLATGEKATTYSGMGVGEGFAVAARAQLANITGYQNTMTNVTTTITAANTALQGMDNIFGQIQTAATSGTQTLNNDGQTTAQNSALAQFGSMVDLLNTQAGNGYIFSGNATNTAPVAPADEIINGNGAQAGLQQIIAERQQADLGTATPPTGRLVITAPTASAPTTVSVGEDVAGSPFGLKLASASVSSDMTNSGTTVNGPTGSPATVSITLGANPAPGDQVNFTFNLPDGTTTTMQLTATTTSPPPAGSFTIGSTPAATASNLNTALNSSISTIASTTLVAASAMAAGNDFFGSAGAAIGTEQSNQAAPVQVTGATLLSGVAGGGFASGDSISVNGQTIQFYNSAGLPPTSAGSTAGTTYLDLATTTVSNLLTNIDTITGTGTPSTISGGVVTLNDDAPGGLSVTSSPSGTLAALGFSGPVSGATVAGSVIDTQASLPAPAPISASTLLAGAAGTNSLTTSFASGDTITVNGQTIQFYSPPATAGSSASTTYLNLATTTIGNLLSSIDAITGTSTPSTVSGGVVTLQSNNGAPLTVSSSNTAAFAALGFAGGTTTATVPPLRVSGSPLGAATSLVSGTPANTVTWYTGGTSTGSARASQVAQIGSDQTVDYGIQANEEGIRSQLQAVAVFAAFTASPSNPNAQAQVAALSTSVGTALSSAAPGQQTMQDIQSDLANAQTTITSATALQTQTQTSLQNMVSQIETVSPDQVASEILSLQTQLQASYQTTSMLSQLSLVKFLPTP